MISGECRSRLQRCAVDYPDRQSCSCVNGFVFTEDRNIGISSSVENAEPEGRNGRRPVKRRGERMERGLFHARGARLSRVTSLTGSFGDRESRRQILSAKALKAQPISVPSAFLLQATLLNQDNWERFRRDTSGIRVLSAGTLPGLILATQQATTVVFQSWRDGITTNAPALATSQTSASTSQLDRDGKPHAVDGVILCQPLVQGASH